MAGTISTIAMSQYWLQQCKCLMASELDMGDHFDAIVWQWPPCGREWAEIWAEHMNSHHDLHQYAIPFLAYKLSPFGLMAAKEETHCNWEAYKEVRKNMFLVFPKPLGQPPRIACFLQHHAIVRKKIELGC